LAENIAAIDAIVPNLTVDEARSWLRRNCTGLRIKASLVLFDSQKESDRGATSFYEDIIDPPKANDFSLATEAIGLLYKHAVVSPEMSKRILDIILKGNGRSPKEMTAEPERNPLEQRFMAASGYFSWLGAFPSVAKEVAPLAVAALTPFYDRLKNTPVGSLDIENDYVEWVLVDFLMNSNSASSIPPEPQAQAMLTKLFSLDGEKLYKVGLDHRAEKWKTHGGK